MNQENPFTVKIAPLLAEYLYVNKRLDLPGIGIFRINISDIPIPESEKDDKSVEVIFFQSDPSTKESPELISFISSKTGKMKSLASADLDSYRELVLQFLNIGRPFLLEGIGNLVKIKSGQYEFTQGEIMREKLREYSGKELTPSSPRENSFTDYENVLFSKKIKIKWGNAFLILLLIAGIGIAIGGSYIVYKKRASKNNVSIIDEKKSEPALIIPDSSKAIKQIDSINLEVPKAQPGKYKFVVEIANKDRGLKRFNTLKDYGLNIQMETTDSINFKLFFLLPAEAFDTAKMIDSLRMLYTPVWSKAFVEN